MKKLITLLLVLTGCVCTANAATIKVYMKPNSWMSGDNAKFSICGQSSSGGHLYWYDFSYNSTLSAYEATVTTNAACGKFFILRMSSSYAGTTDASIAHWGEGEKWNQSAVLSQPSTDVLYDFTDSGASGDGYSVDPTPYLPWRYYFMSNKSGSWKAEGEMIETSGTHLYTFSRSTYAGYNITWAPGNAFKTDGTVNDWTKAFRPATSGGYHWILFETYTYASIGQGDQDVRWHVPVTAADGHPNYVAEGQITISYVPASSSATISSAKTITIGDAGYATWSNSEKYKIANDNVTDVYVVSAKNTGSVTLNSVIGSTFAGGTGVIIKGNGTVTINAVANDATPSDLGTNYLVGSGNSTLEIVGGTGKYIFNWDGDDASTVGFYKANNGTLGAHKAYLNLSASGSREFYGFDFDEPTGIEAVESNPETVKENAREYYNLNGQRVMNPSKGLYIVNGKKVIIK